MINKILWTVVALVVIVILFFQGSAFIFNHFDPWVSMLFSILCIAGFISLLIYIIKKTIKK